MNANELPMQPGVFFGQMVGVLMGLFLMLAGAALLYGIAYTRRHAQQFEGTLLGLRRRGDYFHSVYQYAPPAGGLHEATSVDGTISAKGRTMGARALIRVLPDHPDEAHEATPGKTWGLALAFLGSGGWLTYYEATHWKRSIFTWIVMALIAAFVGRKLWRRVAPAVTKLRAQPAASYAWSALPIEDAETLGAQPRTDRVRVSSANPQSAGLCCIVGLVVLAVAYIPAHRLLLLRSGTRVQGTVFRLNLNTQVSSSIFPSVQYTGADGAVIRFLDRTGENPSPYKVGDPVTVLYLPGKPDTAMIDRGLGNWEGVGFTLLLGMVMTGLGFFGLRARSNTASVSMRRVAP